MTEELLDAFLIKKGFVLDSYDEFENLMDQCPFVIRVKCADYGPKYNKFTVMSVSLRMWIVFIPRQ